MSRIKLAFERPDLSDLPTALRPQAPSRRELPVFIDDVETVIVTGVKIPFFSLVWLLIKLALATTVAGLVIGAVAWGSLVLYQLAQAHLMQLKLTDILNLLDLQTG